MKSTIYPMSNILLCLALTAAVGFMTPVHSYVVGDGNTNHDLHVNRNILTRFDFQCKLLMMVGRTPNTEMPLEWAASGAKLGLPLQVRFSTNECEEFKMIQESLLLGDRGVGASLPSVLPLNEPTFISSKGQEHVKVTQGAFSCQIQVPDTEQYSLRFFLDFPEGATRNDVVLPAGRIFFMTACWNTDTNLIKRAKRVTERNAEQIRSIDVELAEMGQVKSFKQMTGRYFILLERRKKLLSQIDMLDEAFPPDDRLVKGPNNLVFLREGVIAVKRQIGRREKYHWVGTFTLGDFLI